MKDQLEKAFNEIHELESSYFLKHYDMSSFTLVRKKIIEILSGLVKSGKNCNRSVADIKEEFPNNRNDCKTKN